MTEDNVQLIGERRVLGLVPGRPLTGDRKDPQDHNMVMVWPHLLVRHGVVAVAVLLGAALYLHRKGITTAQELSDAD